MECSRFTSLSILIIFVYLTSFSNSKTIVKKLPGFRGDLPFTFETGYVLLCFYLLIMKTCLCFKIFCTFNVGRYVGVGEHEEVQFFYYFIESQRNPSEDPLLLYLTGGPGTSGLFPLLYQIGKFIIIFVMV